MRENLTKNVALLCPTCGNGQFRFEDDPTELVECVGCQRRFRRDELISENSEAIHEGFNELAEEAIEEAAKELNTSLRRAFSGNKHIRLK